MTTLKKCRMKKPCASWLAGLIEGDGYTDERHVELYNSSESLLLNSLRVFKSLNVPLERIRIDVYSDDPNTGMISRWSKTLDLPSANFKLRRNTSPWKSRTEKLRLRVASKEFANVVNSEILNPKNVDAYVAGLFDAEASVDIKGYIEFKQVNNGKGPEIVRKVHEIITSRGLRTTDVRIKNDMGIKQDAYFYVKDVEKYGEMFGFFDERKREKLDILSRIRKANKKPELEKLKKLISENKGYWDILSELNSPYHRVRELIKSNRLTIRQTR